MAENWGAASIDGVEPTTYNVLFVCTGNTCRSPMAEMVARAEVARRGWRHVSIGSAGVSAAPGSHASPAAIAAVANLGMDLRSHRARLLDETLVDWADVILVMSPSHLFGVEDLGGGNKVALLGDFAAGFEGGGAPVADPFGGGLSTYQDTLADLAELVPQALDRIASIVRP